MARAKEDRLGVGQLLVRLLHQYRRDVLSAAAELGYADIRAPHLQVLAHMTRQPVRLSALAAQAQLSLAATSEFVTELEELGYLQRQPDPADGRAKLIVLRPRGRQAFRDGRAGAKHIERNWAKAVGGRRFEQACRVLQELLDNLTETSLAGDVEESESKQDRRSSRKVPVAT